MNEEDLRSIATEIGTIKGVLGTLITWIGQSSVGVISAKEAEILLNTLHDKTAIKP